MTNIDAVVGIDLGTTNSLVGTVVDSRATLFPVDDAGGELLPSAVSLLPGGELLVGRAARNRRLVDPGGTVVSVKRRMGTNERLLVGERRLSPQQISALILRRLADCSEQALGGRPERAVITVPAWFDDAQRQATRDAGELAGLAVERLVNEPTAAALGYRTGAEQSVLVYDFGGGTFDVSVLERDEDLLEVRSSRGDTQLGGDDVDRNLLELVLDRLGKARAGVEADPRALTRLAEAVERAKIALSDEGRSVVRLYEPFLAGEGAAAVHLDIELARQDVDRAARALVERTLRCIDDALRDARMRAQDLDRVLLVGGSSKMPVVRRSVAEHLGMPARTELDADRAVALGAALLAGRAAGAQVRDVLVDITPHSLVAGAADEQTFGVMATTAHEPDLSALVVIPRDAPVPVERKVTVATLIDDQEEAHIPVAQGERPRLADNTPLGSVMITALPPSPAGSPVEVTYRLDLSGVLHVSAIHVPSGRSADVRIADSPYALSAQRRVTEREEIDELGLAHEPNNDVESGPGDADVALAHALLARAGRAVEATPAAEPHVVERVRGAAVALSAALERNEPELHELSDALSDALLDLM